MFAKCPLNDPGMLPECSRNVPGRFLHRCWVSVRRCLVPTSELATSLMKRTVLKFTRVMVANFISYPIKVSTQTHDAGVMRNAYLHHIILQSTSREHSVNIQSTFSQHSVNIQSTFSQHSVNIQSTFSEPAPHHHSANIKGTSDRNPNLKGVLPQRTVSFEVTHIASTLLRCTVYHLYCSCHTECCLSLTACAMSSTHPPTADRRTIRWSKERRTRTTNISTQHPLDCL